MISDEALQWCVKPFAIEPFTDSRLNIRKRYMEDCHAELEDALITACSCAAAGVPMSEIFVQQYQTTSIFESLQTVTLIGFDPMTPVKTRSTIYRLV